VDHTSSEKLITLVLEGAFMIQKQRFALNFFLCVWDFFLETGEAFKPQIKNKSFHSFLFPPSKSYERVFINDWGAASLNKREVKCSISFFNKEAFFLECPI